MTAVDGAVRPSLDVSDSSEATEELVAHVEGELARVYGSCFAPVICRALAEFTVEAVLSRLEVAE